MSRVTESDERMIVEAAQQDPGRFAELYEQNFHRVYAYIACRIQDRSQRQDLTAHVFQQALANIRKFNGVGLRSSPGSIELPQTRSQTTHGSSHVKWGKPS